MRLTWIDPAQMTEGQFGWIVAGSQLGGWSELDVAQALLTRRWLAFEFERGVIAVEVRGDRMVITSICAERFGHQLRALHKLLLRLAADLQCNTAETTVFDERLMRAMMAVEAKPEAWVMVWQVGGNDRGQ